ncbi:hypothetical protein J2W95_001047 [Flavobacterium granuli]|uniref:Uncharacterized protein n=1 Tax=Flavobacterium granuli TaxID=280093 RepID=A0ABU1RZZ8_9FLAO|nr:hypothetical protein [Flavobacterium granuli]
MSLLNIFYFDIQKGLISLMILCFTTPLSLKLYNKSFRLSRDLTLYNFNLY